MLYKIHFSYQLCYFTLSASFLYSFFTLHEYSLPLSIPSYVYAQRSQARSQRSHPNSLKTLSLCVCKFGLAKLTVDYLEDQRRQRKITMSAMNNTFGVLSNNVQDRGVSYDYSITTDCIYSCILTATVQHSPQDSGF